MLIAQQPQTTMCIACEIQQPSAEVTNAFANRFIEILNHGALASMVSIGHRTGLFEALRAVGPATSAQLAEAAELNERYVREWLGVMTCGGIVECDDAGKIYHLPPAHAAVLTSAGESIAHLSGYITMIGTVEDQLIECFRKGGGVPYSAYPRFHELMVMDSKQSVVDPMFDHVLPLIPGITLALHNGINVLDVGCGRGKALLKLAERFPNSTFTGWDLGEKPIREANEEAAALGLTNVTFAVRDLSDFHQTAPQETFDFITAFDAIHDQARPDHVLAGIRRALKPDGVFLMQDIGGSSNVANNRDHPIGTLLYSISCSHCMTVSLAQGGLGVGAMWGEEMTREFITNAGFREIERRTLDHDLQNYYYIIRR